MTAAAFVALLVHLLAPAAHAVEWSTSFAEAVERSRKANKPILVDFQAPWCYSCYYMDRHVLSGEAFARKAKEFVALKVDVDQPEGNKLKAARRVVFLPTFLLLSPGAEKELGRIVGERTEADFMPLLGALLAGETTEPDLEKLRARAEKGDIEALEKLLDRPVDCSTVFDVMGAAAAVDKLEPRRRKEILAREKRTLERLVDVRAFVDRGRRCADFRSTIGVLAEVHGKLGDQAAVKTLYARTVELLEADGLALGDDRSHDENLRHFLELAEDDAKTRAFYERLAPAYPADYVYPYRYARYLLGRGKHAEAMPWIEKADKLAYGANRLMVTNFRAKILAGLGRKKEAVALLKRDIKAGSGVFPDEVKRLQETLRAL